LDPRLKFAVIGGEEHAKADTLTPSDLEQARIAGVRFLGSRDNVVPLYAGMDLFVLASHRERFPRAAMEAAAMGPPIIATTTRGPARRATLDDVDTIVDLHAGRIADGFLVTLGRPFLRRLYRRMVRSPRAFALVAEDGGNVCGFVAAAEDTGAFYREFLVRDG